MTNTDTVTPPVSGLERLSAIGLQYHAQQVLLEQFFARVHFTLGQRPGWRVSPDGHKDPVQRDRFTYLGTAYRIGHTFGQVRDDREVLRTQVSLAPELDGAGRFVIKAGVGVLGAEGVAFDSDGRVYDARDADTGLHLLNDFAAVFALLATGSPSDD